MIQQNKRGKNYKFHSLYFVLHSLIDFVDRWFVHLNKVLSLGIKHKKNIKKFLLFCSALAYSYLCR